MLQEISIAVIALCMLLITTGLVAILFLLWRAMKALKDLLEQFRREFQPLAVRIGETVERARLVAEGTLDEMQELNTSLSSVRDRARRLGVLFEVLEEDLERATLRLFSLFTGLGRFIRTAFRPDLE